MKSCEHKNEEQKCKYEKQLKGLQNGHMYESEAQKRRYDELKGLHEDLKRELASSINNIVVPSGGGKLNIFVTLIQYHHMSSVILGSS